MLLYSAVLRFSAVIFVRFLQMCAQIVCSLILTVLHLFNYVLVVKSGPYHYILIIYLYVVLVSLVSPPSVSVFLAFVAYQFICVSE